MIGSRWVSLFINQSILCLCFCIMFSSYKKSAPISHDLCSGFAWPNITFKPESSSDFKIYRFRDIGLKAKLSKLFIVYSKWKTTNHYTIDSRATAVICFFKSASALFECLRCSRRRLFYFFLRRRRAKQSWKTSEKKSRWQRRDWHNCFSGVSHSADCCDGADVFAENTCDN